MNSKLIDKLAYIHVQNRQVLMTMTKGKTVWYVPGGKREKGETDTEALIREVKEEMDIDLKEETIEYYGTFEAQAHGKTEGTIVRMTCYTADFEGNPKPSSEIEKVSFQDYSIYKSLGPVDKIIFDDLKKRNCID